MKRLFLIVPLMLVFAQSACGRAATPAAVPTVSLDVVPQSSAAAGTVSASAVVVPIKKVELSFPNGGVVKTIEVAAGDSVNAGQPLVTLDSSILEARVVEAQANVVTQTTTLKYLKRTIESQERLDAAQANIDAASAEVDIAKAQLAQATLAAPFAGTIASVDISPAEFANPGQAIVSMGDLTAFQIETTDLSEKDVASLKVGQHARVFVAALNQELAGTVSDIARVSNKVGGDVVFKVTIHLDEQPSALRWGMSAKVNIDSGS